jgi:hypothetical protein
MTEYCLCLAVGPVPAVSHDTAGANLTRHCFRSARALFPQC